MAPTGAILPPSASLPCAFTTVPTWALSPHPATRQVPRGQSQRSSVGRPSRTTNGRRPLPSRQPCPLTCDLIPAPRPCHRPPRSGALAAPPHNPHFIPLKPPVLRGLGLGGAARSALPWEARTADPPEGSSSPQQPKAPSEPGVSSTTRSTAKVADDRKRFFLQTEHTQYVAESVEGRAKMSG